MKPVRVPASRALLFAFVMMASAPTVPAAATLGAVPVASRADFFRPASHCSPPPGDVSSIQVTVLGTGRSWNAATHLCDGADRGCSISR